MMANTSNDVHEQQFAHGVRTMFSGIAARYDLLNHLLSLNVDKLWRRRLRNRLAPILASPDARIIDVACGTGDVAIELTRGSKAYVVGTDFCRPMLAIADRKSKGRIDYVESDAMALSFPDDRFDALTIAFGLRNVANRTTALREFHRVLRPGGMLAILEFSKPGLPALASVFDLYFRKVLPSIGGALSGSRSAYEYLPSSVGKFPDQEGLAALMAECGFIDVRYENLTGGIAAIHTALKPFAL